MKLRMIIYVLWMKEHELQKFNRILVDKNETILVQIDKSYVLLKK